MGRRDIDALLAKANTNPKHRAGVRPIPFHEQGLQRGSGKLFPNEVPPFNLNPSRKHEGHSAKTLKANHHTSQSPTEGGMYIYIYSSN